MDSQDLSPEPTSKPPVRIRELRFNDGTVLSVAPSAIVVFVGANNVGKSKALQNIASQTGARGQDATDHHVLEVELEWEDDKDAAVAWFADNLPVKSLANGDFYEARGHRVAVDRVGNEVRSEAQLSVRLGKLISIYANAEDRLSLTRSVSAIDLSQQQPEHPIHILADRQELLEQLSNFAESAFGSQWTLDSTAGASLVLRLGMPKEEPAFSRHGIPSRGYVSSLRELPTLESQGHGIRSYIGMLMELLSGSNLVVLLDEPEAFLHPPQAEKIGTAISAVKRDESQVFVATHDANIVKGFLSYKGSQSILVIRVRRVGSRNPVAILDSVDLEALWSDPALRYSNVFDGLFSEGAVVCEGDPDCRLYESALDLVDEQGAAGFHFTHGGGAGRIPVIASALKAVSVPTAAIVDLDLFGQRDLLARIVESVGGIWNPKWDLLINTLESGVNSLAEFPSKATIAKAVSESLEGVKDEDVPPGTSLKRIRSVASKKSGWHQLKTKGGSVLPGGDCTRAFNELLEELASVGVFLVPVGELERWFPSVGGHGPAHVSELQETGLIEGESGKRVRDFVSNIRRFLRS